MMMAGGGSVAGGGVGDGGDGYTCRTRESKKWNAETLHAPHSNTLTPYGEDEEQEDDDDDDDDARARV